MSTLFALNYLHQLCLFPLSGRIGLQQVKLEVKIPPYDSLDAQRNGSSVKANCVGSYSPEVAVLRSHCAQRHVCMYIFFMSVSQCEESSDHRKSY
jgi:hypothetical protein